jgi:hypothetical protein
LLKVLEVLDVDHLAPLLLDHDETKHHGGNFCWSKVARKQKGKEPGIRDIFLGHPFVAYSL